MRELMNTEKCVVAGGLGTWGTGDSYLIDRFPQIDLDIDEIVKCPGIVIQPSPGFDNSGRCPR